MNRSCLTLDVDWVSDELLAPILEAIRAAGVRATIFATHPSELLASLDGDDLEVGLHPNFDDAGGDFERPIRALKEAFPHAVGGRSHALFVSSRILRLYADNGLDYESNIFLPAHRNLHPVTRFRDLVSIPFFWSDDKHVELERPFDVDALDFDAPGLRVYNFHPIHIHMNTRSEAHYASYRAHHNDLEALAGHVNRDADGVGTLFRAFLDRLGAEGGGATMRDICELHRHEAT